MIHIETLSILVVDDMKSMRLTIRKMLKHLNIGKKLKFAENGRQGLEILNTEKCDLAILDWNMPVMNGLEMLENIREEKAFREMPVIMVTAEAERDVVSEVAETEIDAYLIKPLTLASLDEKVRAVVQKANYPDPATRHRLTAKDLEENGEIDAAIEQVKTALTHKPNASRLLRQLGLLHFKINKNSMGEKCLIKAVSVNKQDILSRVYLADYLINNNRLEKAGQFYLEILSLSSRYDAKALELGEKLLIKGARETAISIFSKVIALSKKHNATRERVIDFCMANSEIDYPQILLEQAIKENPSNYDTLYKAGLVSLEAGNEDKALRFFLTVDRKVKGQINAKLQIAKILISEQKILKADEYLNQILRMEPENEAAMALRRRI